MNTKLILVFLAFFLVYPKHLLATNYFFDDFTENNLIKWNLDVGTSVWKVDPLENKLVSQVWYQQQSYLVAKDLYNLTDYEYDVDVNNISGVDQHILFRVNQDLTEFYQLELRYPDSNWPQGPSNIVRLWRYKNGSYQKVVPDLSFQLIKNNKNNVKIILNQSTIKIYINDYLVIDVVEKNSDVILKGSVGLHAYAGDYHPGFVTNYYDNIIVTSIKSVYPKIIFLPGLGGSWNTEAMVYNKNVSDDQWKMTPFVKNYNNLIKGFKENNLIENKDFYVWNYDWRSPIDLIENKLNNFILSNIKPDDKFILVGHSLGAVLSRIWAQDHPEDKRLQKVIGLAGPQMGSIDAYTAWNGINLKGSVDFYNVALSLLSKINGEKSVRQYAPVLKDLIPIFDFAKIDGKIKSASTLTNPNNYLSSKNLGFSNIDSVVGIGETTEKWINLTKRNYFHRYLGFWEDGSPLSYSYSDGDGTVLDSSASLGNIKKILSNHGDIVDKDVNNILISLGLGKTVAAEPVNTLKDNMFVFLGSPATVEVKCQNNTYLDDDKDGFIIFNSLNSNQCNVIVTGTGNGTYHLVTAKIGFSNSWNYFENEIGIGQTQTVYLSPQNGQPKCINSNYYFGLIKRDVDILLAKYPKNDYLLDSLKAIKNQDYKKLTKAIIKFRKKSREIIVTNRVINNLWLIVECKYVDDKPPKNRWLQLIYWMNSIENSNLLDKYKVADYQKIKEIYQSGDVNMSAKLFLIDNLTENVL